MSETEHRSQDEFTSVLVEEIGLAKRPAGALADNIESEAELVERLRENASVSDFTGVGSQSANRVWRWFRDEHPDANRERLEQAVEYCTEFTTDHEPSAGERGADEFQFAFVCPRCDADNPLTGDPRDFKTKPYTCRNCRWVPLLVAAALEEFAQEHYDADEDGDGDE